MTTLQDRLRRGFGTSAGTKAQREGYQYICIEAADRIDEQDKRIAELESAITKTLNENGHLADGDNCTLADLKRVMGEKT
jgi:hypothetical protein